MILHNRMGVVLLPVGAFVLLGLLLGPTAQADLIGQWTFNEGSGNVALDSTANGNNGDIRGGPSYVASPGGFAISLEGYDESGNGDWVNFGDLPLFRLNGPKSLEAWFMPGASQMSSHCDNTGGIGSSSEPHYPCKDFEILGRGWKNYSLSFETSNQTGDSKSPVEKTGYYENDSACGGNADGYQWEVSTCSEGPYGPVFPGTAFEGPCHQGPNCEIPMDPYQGTWRHVAAVSDPTQEHPAPRTLIYVDGVEINGHDARIENTNNVSRVLSAGGFDDTTGNHFVAMIDELRIHNSYLSAAEVLASFQAGPVIPEPATLGLLGLGSLLMLKRRR